MGIKWRDKRGKSKRKIQGFSFPFSIAIRIEPARLNVVHGGVDLEISDNSDDSSESTLSSTPCPASSSSDKYSLLLLDNSNWNDEDSNSIRKMMIKSHILNGWYYFDQDSGDTIYIYIFLYLWLSISKLRAILRGYSRPSF